MSSSKKATKRYGNYNLSLTLSRYMGGRILLYLSATKRDVSLREDILVQFDTNDERKTHWVGITTIDDQTYYYPLKYKS